MTDNAIASRVSPGDYYFLSHYVSAAITAAATKWEWMIPFPMRIVDVICDSETVAAGAGDDVIDVNINGTTIYTTQANRPTLTAGDTGLFAEALEPEIVDLTTGDIVSYDVDSVGAGNGSARFKILIVCQRR